MSKQRRGRGAPADRRRRQRWLLETYGDGTTAPCAIRWDDGCAGTVTIETLTVDRWPITAMNGGTYARGNIRPACWHCNQAHGWDQLDRHQRKMIQRRRRVKRT